MSSILPIEILPGLMAHLDTSILLRDPKCMTNVPNLALIPNRAGPFLVLSRDLEEDGFLCVPLYSHSGVNRLQLDQSAKHGHPGWTAPDSYWHRQQFWVIPATALCRASHLDLSRCGRRNFYASDRLEEIVAHRDDSGVPFRLIASLVTTRPAPPIPNPAVCR